MKIITHPDNIEALKVTPYSVPTKGSKEGELFSAEFSGVQIIQNSMMERTKPSGKYILNGKVIKKEQIRIPFKFGEYGPEDLEFLLYAGLIKEDQEPLFYKINPEAFQIRMDFGVYANSPLPSLSSWNI